MLGKIGRTLLVLAFGAILLAATALPVLADGAGPNGG
jgi:hypothetical protein